MQIFYLPNITTSAGVHCEILHVEFLFLRAGRLFFKQTLAKRKIHSQKVKIVIKHDSDIDHYTIWPIFCSAYVYSKKIVIILEMINNAGFFNCVIFLVFVRFFAMLINWFSTNECFSRVVLRSVHHSYFFSVYGLHCVAVIYNKRFI